MSEGRRQRIPGRPTQGGSHPVGPVLGGLDEMPATHYSLPTGGGEEPDDTNDPVTRGTVRSSMAPLTWPHPAPSRFLALGDGETVWTPIGG